MVDRRDDVTVRFSRRELALVFEAVDFMAVPEDPDDQRLVLGLRDLLAKEFGEKLREAGR